VSAPLRIDADVHCAVPSVEALCEYLDEHWAEFVTLYGREPRGVGVTYPQWLPMLATVGEDLTLDGVREAVLTQARAAILTCYYAVESFTHPYLGPAIARAVNRWVAREWLDREPRLLAQATITPQHLDEALEEIDRIGADDRFVGVLLPSRSPDAYGKRRYWPILEALAERRLTLTINVGGAAGTPNTPVNWLGSFFGDHAAATLPFQAQVMSLTFSGVFKRYPDLTVVLAESGWTWLPPVMWRMDQEWKAARREVPWLEEPPSSYVRRHFRLTTQPTDAPADLSQLDDVYDQLGSDQMLLYASDHPHQQGTGQAALLDRLTPNQRRAVEHDNAFACFDLGRRGIGLEAAAPPAVA
jgi:predicted TIM-barrel fold metal-dependent hydrolase